MPVFENEIRKRLTELSLDPLREAEIVEELSHHLEDRYRDELVAGASEDQALRAALSQLTDIRSFVEGFRRVERPVDQEPVVSGAGGRSLVGDLRRDLRYGVRAMLRSPGFTLMAVVTLALGIGPMTAIFALAHTVLAKPLPFRAPDRLVMVWKNEGNPSSVPDFIDWRDRNQVCERMGAFSPATFNLLSEGEPEAIRGAFVSADMLAALGVEPFLGRWFHANDDKTGAAPMVVLSHDLWRERFGGDPGVIDRQLDFDAKLYTVVGVMPRGFDFPRGVRLWATTTFDAGDPGAPRGANFLNVVALLRPDVSVERARANLLAILQPQYPNPIQLNVVPLHEQLVGDVRTPLLVLLGAIAFVLLIACANVANLLLVRATARRKEVAVRTALGASRFRLVRQFMTESLLLATTGGMVGLMLAFLSLDLLASLSPMKIPRISEVAIDGRVIGFLSLIVLLAGALPGTLSGVRISEGDLSEGLREGGGRATSGRSRRRLRDGLVVAEVALSLILLIGTGLMLRSFLNLGAVHPGFNPEGVLCANLSLPLSRYPEGEQRAGFIREVLERLEALPGVHGVASAAYVPMSGSYNSRRFAIEGVPLPEPGREPFASNTPVSPAYFSTLGIPLAAGRAFTAADGMRSPDVAIVNQTFARRYFPGEVIGRRVRFYSSGDPQPPWLEIVGVAGDVRQVALSAESRPEIYVPHAQSAWSFLNFLVRTDGDPMDLAGALKGAIKEVDKDQPVFGLATLEEVLAGSIADRRGLMFLLGVFAAVALLLASVGIYGVVSHSVSQRTHEIGIRLAMGAKVTDVLRLILRQGLVLTVVGIAIGVVGSLVLTRLMSDLLFQVSTTDVITFIGVPMFLGAVALLACYIPARRATRVDPLAALRCE